LTGNNVKGDYWEGYSRFDLARALCESGGDAKELEKPSMADSVIGTIVYMQSHNGRGKFSYGLDEDHCQSLNSKRQMINDIMLFHLG
jgi:hypothetical protein